jgi:uncharacterized protein YjlB
MYEPRTLRLAPNDWVPNNPNLPVVIYRNAIHYDLLDLAGAFEVLFARNGWVPDWRGTLHDRHHFHSSAHEVLGVSRGSAIVMLGGLGGPKVALDESDALFLPAGTGHCQLRGSMDFQIVAAYPEGQRWNTHSAAIEAEDASIIAALPHPTSDPILGTRGPLAVPVRNRPSSLPDLRDEERDGKLEPE